MIPEVFSALDPASTVARLLADAVGLPAVTRPGRRLFMVVVPAVAQRIFHTLELQSTLQGADRLVVAVSPLAFL